MLQTVIFHIYLRQSPTEHMKWQFEVGNKNNAKMWKTRKKRFKNGFKPDTVIKGRPKKAQVSLKAK